MIQKLLLFGYPVAHSRSPVIHNAALQAVDLADWVYAAQAVPPDELPMAVARLRQPDYIGANVTIPHKERIIPLLDDLTPAAQAIGAVNTIFKDGKRLVGENTDAPGFLADLKHHLVRQAVSLSKDEQADRLPYNDVGRTVNLSKASNGLMTPRALALSLGKASGCVRASQGHPGRRLPFLGRRTIGGI